MIGVARFWNTRSVRPTDETRAQATLSTLVTRPRHVPRGVLALVALVTIGATSGCGSPEVEMAAPTAGAEVSPAQQAEIADGVVTSEEYHEAFRRYAACLADGGFDIVVLGEDYDLIETRLEMAAVDAGVDGPCYESEYKLVDTQWQLDHIDTSYTAEVARRCLVDHGLEVPEHYADMVIRLEENGVPFSSCPAAV